MVATRRKPSCCRAWLPGICCWLWHWKKGIGTLLEALSLLPEHVTLKIVDGRIPSHGLVPRLTKQYGLENRIKIVDRMLTVPELVEQYSTAKVALVPSFFEGFGFPASEAMACGLSVIANAAGALPEVVGTDGPVM